MAFSALLDSCVLFPVSLRDTLLRVAERGVYRPLWSEPILFDLRLNVVERYPDISPERFDSMLEDMREAFEDATVTGFEPLIDSMTNDVSDRHVLAAAVAGRADVIVTHNVRDFPPTVCDPFGIDVQTPDEFLIHAFHLGPDLIVDVLRRQAADKKAPPMELEDLLDALERTVPDFVEEVRRYAAAA